MAEHSTVDAFLKEYAIVPGFDGEGEAPADRTLPAHPVDGATWHVGEKEGGSVLVFLARGEIAADVADAARRSQLVVHQSLVPIAAVHELTDDDGTAVAAVVYERVDAPSLSDMARERALRPETVRSIAGQASVALEAARRKGVTHRLLDEDRVFVDADADRVLILGAGVESAALSDLDIVGLTSGAGRGSGEGEPGTVDPDARSLGRILFVGLTGRDSEFFGGSDVVDPQLASARTVPDDLRDITVMALTYVAPQVGDPVYEPQDVHNDLRPWQSLPVTLEAFDPEQRVGAPQPLSAAQLAVMRGEEPPVEDAPADDAPADQAPAAGTVSDQPASESASEPTDPAAASGSTAAGGAFAAGPEGDDAPTSPSVLTDGSADDTTPGAGTAGASTAGAAAAGAATGGAAAAGAADSGAPATQAWGDAIGPAPEFSSRTDRQQTRAEAESAAATGPLRVAGRTESLSGEPATTTGGIAMSSSSSAAAGAAGAAALGAAGSASTGGRTPHDPTGVGSVPTASEAPAPVDPSKPTGAPEPVNPSKRSGRSAPVEPVHPSAAAALTSANDTPRGAGAPAIPVPGRQRSMTEPPTEDTGERDSPSLLRDVVGVAFASDDPDSLSTGDARGDGRSYQSRILIILMIVLVALAGFLAINTVTSVNRDRGVSSEPAKTVEPTATAESEAPAEKSPEPAKSEEPKVEPAALKNAEIVYPEDPSKADYPENAGRINDGDMGTVWKTKEYASEDFGNLRNGMGVLLNFEKKGEVTEVIVHGGEAQGGTLELRTVNPDGTPGDVLASTDLNPGEMSLKPEEPVEAERLMLWSPKPGALPNGRFRVDVAEVEVK
ncbi:protein kinase family protein [Helcobacillus massiliensis]|uniref:hypothetical protein n=1 Tax=Helcobacillus massiliensis TaxID=521392 RepID=UPI0025579DE6|nr:hypothetical protein [Helcobacillus massiliensis]MDK7741363.1 hypothetical protein [Helcobacillus massiliensis]WOO92789.1 hypothetical protein R3I40_10315 [Helcobacillus massiliensis]